MNNPAETSAILFDLDGTLADTAPDMGAALNQMLKEEGLAPLSEQQLRPAASQGGRSMVQRGYGEDLTAEQLESRLQRFLNLYREGLCIKTQLFPNVQETLKQLSERHITWGIVTNKPEFLAEPLLAALDLDTHAACRIYGDTTPEKKPSPLPLLYAAEVIARKPEHCIYVGDSERDVRAAADAGMNSWFAAYGYETALPGDIQADRVIDDISDILEHLNPANTL